MNTKTKAAIGAVLVLSLGVAGASFAHGKRGDGPRGGGAEQIFERFDTNEDGTITRAEAEAFAAARFAEADANADGLLSEDELTAQAEKDGAERRVRRVSRMIERLDGNDDGQLSPEEMSSRGMDRMFDRLDANDDGSVTREEVAEARKGHGRWGREGKRSDN